MSIFANRSFQFAAVRVLEKKPERGPNRSVLALAMNEKSDSFVEPPSMKYLPPFLLLAAMVVSSCSDVEEPPSRVKRRAANYPAQNQPQQYPPQQQPFNPNGPAQTETASREESAGPAPTAAPTKASKGDYPYGIPVPGKPHLVESPFSPGKYVDVEGFPPGTEVKDPYTQKIFLVP